jgi:hypothetical protein
MTDMEAHLEKLRDQAAECAILSGEAETKEKRELFATLHSHLTSLANQVARVMASTAPPDTFLGRKTHEPFPKEDE